jgi:hypothetical protein
MIETTNDTTGKWWVVVENLLRKSPLPKFVTSCHRRHEAKAVADERNRAELSASLDRQDGRARTRHYVLERTDAIKHEHLKHLDDRCIQATEKAAAKTA